jgi:hypothetical protein
VQRYGAQAKPILLHEPYRVAREIDGIGFKTADRIAINLGFANDAPPRPRPDCRAPGSSNCRTMTAPNKRLPRWSVG